MLHGTKAECYFLDVGQGTSQIITLGQGRAIVIDAGPADLSNTLLQTLENLQIHTLEAVVLSHNDDDHIGNATNLLLQYPNSIGSLFFMRDRDIHNNVKYKNLVRCIGKMLSEGNLDRRVIHDLVPSHNQRETELFRERDAMGFEIILNLIYPTALWDSIQAQMNGTPNDTCAVLMLSIGTSRIVFSGDAPFEAWIQMRNDGQIFPLEVNAATIPHHGGSLACTGEEEKKFYSEMLCPKTGIISVGSRNLHNHPRPETIKNLVKSGIGILCTGMTQKCADISKWKMNPLRFRPPEISRSYSTGLSCSGTVVVNIASQAIEIKHYDRYRRWIEKHPDRLCKPEICRIPKDSQEFTE